MIEVKLGTGLPPPRCVLSTKEAPCAGTLEVRWNGQGWSGQAPGVDRFCERHGREVVFGLVVDGWAR